MIGKIQYGDVILDVSKVNDVRRDVCLSDDGVDYLYTATTIDVTCTLNPNATSFANLIGAAPVAGRAFAGRTDRVLQDYLSTPRRTLIMWAYDADGRKVVYLQSPPSGNAGRRARILESDAKNGPICKVLAVNGADVHGGKTWMLHLIFQTWINNCYDKESPILSHRWERNVDYDEQYRAIVTTRGKVVFHVGRLWNNQQSPDHYRQQFFQPPPANFAREHVSVDVASDNTTATYTVVDGERFFSLGATSPAVKLEATLMTMVEHGTLGNAMANAAPQVSNSLFGMAQNAFPSILTFSPSQVIGHGMSGISAMAGSVASNLPTYTASISVRAHGAKNSQRKELYKLCLAVAFARIGEPTFFSRANRISTRVTQKLDDTFVEVNMSIGWYAHTLVQLTGVLGGYPAMLASFGVGALTDAQRKSFLDSYFSDVSDRNINGNDTAIRSNVGLGGLPEELQSLRFTAGGVDQGFLKLITQDPSVGNRPMNQPSKTDAPQPDIANSRGIGYTRVLMAQALLGDLCTIPPMPGQWDAAGIRNPTVPVLNVPFLPNVGDGQS